GVTILWGTLAKAQEPTHLSWLDRATITRSSQPHWVTPLITASANLEDSGGPKAGKTQAFLTPGVILGRFPVTRSSGFAFGVGMQIAATQYHSYDHSLLFTVRLPMQSHPRE
ncbi:MAG TPA: hypothetical protein VGM27_13540, partial [Acidobacteriaceae bacterium]